MLAEILNFQGTNPILGMGSFSELFKKIPLDPSHWEGNAGEIVFQLTKRIDFLESLISELKGVKYLRHVKRIRDRIEMWKSTIKEEELRAICRKLYQ